MKCQACPAAFCINRWQTAPFLAFVSHSANCRSHLVQPLLGLSRWEFTFFIGGWLKKKKEKKKNKVKKRECKRIEINEKDREAFKMVTRKSEQLV